jgi:8-oxo-dGTP diphosphatase
MKKMKVCCAVIQNASGEVLLVQRPAYKKNGNQWEFPGGKVEDGESLEECIHREILEELSIHIFIKRTLPFVQHSYQNVTIELYPFLCSFDSSERIRLNEHINLKWIQSVPDQLSNISPADIVILRQLFIKKSNP